jgi:hypothetical protein
MGAVRYTAGTASVKVKTMLWGGKDRLEGVVTPIRANKKEAVVWNSFLFHSLPGNYMTL